MKAIKLFKKKMCVEVDMKVLRFMRIFSLTACLLGLFTVWAMSASAAGELTVSNITRLSHPAYDMSNYWKGQDDAINADSTKILLLEDWSTWTHPDYPGAGIGRGIVVANINDLKNACDRNNCMNNPTQEQLNQWLIDYKAVTQPLNNSFLSYKFLYYYDGMEVGRLQEGGSVYVRWSPILGEENILYGIYQGSKREIIRIDVTNGSTTIVGNYVAETSQTVAPYLYGWTSDNKLIFHYWYHHNSGGFLLDVKNGSKEYYSSLPGRCSEQGWRFPMEAIHNGRSPDKKYIVGYHSDPTGNGIYINDSSDPENGLEGGCSTSLEYAEP